MLVFSVTGYPIMRFFAVKYHLGHLVPVLIATLAFTASARAEGEPDSSSDSDTKTKTISGVIEAVVSKEISADTEQIASLTIERLVPHGATIKAGQNVVWFDAEPITEQMKGAEREMRLSTLGMQEEDFNHEQFVEGQKLDRAAAERTWKAAQQAYQNFVKVDRERTIATQENLLKGSLASLENAREELDQLQQMYDADELTEESEEIVLKRAKRSVEAAEFRHQSTEIAAERAITDPPRTLQAGSNTRANIMPRLNAICRSQPSAKSKFEKVTSSTKRSRNTRNESERKVVISSPLAGIAAHGKLSRGTLGDKPALWKKGSSVTGAQVSATVLAPGKLQVRLDVNQEDLPSVQPGTKCTVVVPGVAGFKGKGTVKSVSSIPYAGSRYDCVVSFSAGKEKLTPTMGCQVIFETTAK